MLGRALRHLTAAAATFLQLALPASADYEAGVAAYAAGDYAAALAEWQPLAEAGDRSSQYGMGLVYESGRGVGRDYVTAARWYELAAQQGHAGAQFNLGHLYRLGTGVPIDMARAASWWREAADQGLSQAQVALGVAYQRGEGVVADPEVAVGWFQRASDNGNPTADYALGLAYETGLGVAKDVDTAIAYYERAAAAGIEAAMTRLGALTFPPTDVPPPPPPKESEVNERLAGAMAEIEPEANVAPNVPSPHFIQIAAYVDGERAQRAWRELQAHHADLLGGLPHRVIEVDLGGDTGAVFRLQAGPMPNAGEAEAICSLLKSRNTDCFLVTP